MSQALSSTPTRIACALAFAALSGAAGAQDHPPPPGYVISSDGAVVMSGSGLCVYADTGNAFLRNNPCIPVAAPVSLLQPAPPAPAIRPAPVVADAGPPPVPPVVARVTFDADALFDFDKSRLRPAGQLALDKFVDELKGLDAGMISAIGYTDRIGADAYNQHLSDQRAQTVSSYLQSRGIEPANVHTEGRGNTQPVTKPGSCSGERGASLIACLQPDRRVEVEVSGSSVVPSMPQ